MAQETPSNILYAQAIQAIKKLMVNYSTTSNKTPDDISETINAALSKYADYAGKTQMKFVPIKKSQIPRSQEINNFMLALQMDTNIGQDQVDLLAASTILTHNNIKTEVLKGQRENQRLQNKIKTLELYSNANDKSLLYFGDNFITEDFIDWRLVSDTERATHLGNGYLSLHLQDQKNALTNAATISILEGSNGFFGNNQELKDPDTSPIDPTTGIKLYKFVAETYKAANNKVILDDKPTTWFEYEKYFVEPGDRSRAKNYNFVYTLTQNTVDRRLDQDRETFEAEGITTSGVDWANGVSDVLKFYFEIKMASDQSVNLITLLPFGLQDNVNNPIHINKVTTSLNGTDWTTLGPENVWISNSIDKKISSINAENILIGNAAWIADGSIIRFIRFEIEQPKPIDCNIGHTFYMMRNNPVPDSTNVITVPVNASPPLTYDSSSPYDIPLIYGGIAGTVNTANAGYSDYYISNITDMNIKGISVDESQFRVEGPNPPIENPQFYLRAKNALVNNMIQRIELFQGKRWAIGIRDISVRSNVYAAKGVVVSKRFNVSGIVDRVALEADVYIPNDYSQTTSWIKFYVSADDGSTWYQISRIQDDFAGIPEIIAFNDPTPVDLREPGVGYYDVKGTVNSLRFKAVITRPAELKTSTPILKSYKLKIIKRS